jgi:DNA-binding Lrp family transcriptional regulator
VVVRHHELGYRANAMVVFDVPDAEVDRIGGQLAAEAGVTLCYRRSRSLPHWPYNLYCMVHGRSRAEAQPVIEGLGELAGGCGHGAVLDAPLQAVRCALFRRSGPVDGEDRSRWRRAAAAPDEIDRRLINALQGDFPLVPEPYRQVGEVARP